MVVDTDCTCCLPHLKLLWNLWAFEILHFGRRPNCFILGTSFIATFKFVFPYHAEKIKKYNLHLIAEYPHLLRVIFIDWDPLYMCLCYTIHKLLHDNPNVIETTGYVLNKLLPDDPKINFPLKIMCHSINWANFNIDCWRKSISCHIIFFISCYLLLRNTIVCS